MSSSKGTFSENKLAGNGKAECQVPFHLDPDLIRDFPPDVARDFGVIPLSKIAPNTLILAAAEEMSAERLKELGERLDHPIHIVPAPGSDVKALVEDVFEEAKEDGDSRQEPGLSQEPDTSQEADSAPRALSHTQETQYSDEPKKLIQILIDLGFLTEEELQEHLKEQESRNKSHFDLSPFIEPKILRLVPDSVARKHQILPLAEVESELLLAAASHLDATVVAEIKRLTGLLPKLIITDAEELEASIKECYRRRQHLKAREMRLGEYLLAQGLIDQEQLDTCRREHENSKDKLGELLVRHGYVTEETVFTYLAEQLGCEYRRFSTGDIDLELSRLVSQRFAERNLVLPLALDHQTKVLEVAMAEPYDLRVIDTLKSFVSHRGYQLKPVLSSSANIKEGVAYLYNFRGLIEDQVEMETISDDPEPDRRELVATEDVPKIRRIINQILYRAVVEGASDIHIESLENRVRVRFRLDGLLQERKTQITKDTVRAVVSVFKVDAGLDITEHRRSQDGVFKMRIGADRFVDFRINLHSTDFGKDAVIRVLDTSRNLMPLDALGCPPKMLERYLKLVENPQGLILFTGPTGSGKSTTLYSTLAHLNSAERKIVTAEDPVEYYLEGICQYKVNESIGNTFGEYARRFLRKDPDIILIGEIRDEDTAEACLRAAMTGHLVFSTLHTNDSVGAVQRLRNLGVDPSSVSEALLAVISQRLARRLCRKCRQPYQPEPTMVSLFYPNGPPENGNFVNGAGCPACEYLGFRGRLGLYEYWELNPEVILAIANEEGDVRTMARRSGLMPLVEDGLQKVQQGTTTLEELRRVLPLDQIRAYTRYNANKE
ncbi:Flp pilus assembly complex ATPase component TadA [Acidobacteria bacterium AH-259-A15]|nr:Flp pilus assembly complex ATPase component TadA [Acidobacteria bacterium AH-259-A15]